MKTLSVLAGIGVAGLVELFGVSLPGIVHQLAVDPTIGPGPGVALGGWFMVLMALGGIALANWLIWTGSTPARAQ